MKEVTIEEAFETYNIPEGGVAEFPLDLLPDPVCIKVLLMSEDYEIIKQDCKDYVAVPLYPPVPDRIDTMMYILANMIGGRLYKIDKSKYDSKFSDCLDEADKLQHIISSVVRSKLKQDYHFAIQYYRYLKLNSLIICFPQDCLIHAVQEKTNKEGYAVLDLDKIIAIGGLL